MKKTTLALLMPLLVTGKANANIIISEVVEGFGYHKAIEVANVGDSQVTLSDYSLQVNTNCAADWTHDYDLGHVTLEPMTTFVIGHNQSSNDQAFKDLLDDAFNTNLTNFNGNDAIRLIKSGQVVDMFGWDQLGQGSGDCAYFAKNVTKRRLVYSPTDTWDEDQWLTISRDDSDYYSDLGNIDPEGATPEPPEGIPATIMQLQGDGPYSPYTNPPEYKFKSDEVFEVTGIVTAIQTASLGSDLPVGFFIQDEHGDGNPATSDGIFVAGSPFGLSVGDEVTVIGHVEEHYYWTRIPALHIEKTGREGISLEPTTIVAMDSDESFEMTLERYEGMLVRVNDETDMHVARTFSFDYAPRRNNMVLSHAGVNYHPNQFNVPESAEAKAQSESNEDRRLWVESFAKAPDGVVPWYSDFGQDNGTGTTDDYIRVGATLNDVGFEGVLGYSFSEYRLYVMNEATAETFENNDRPTTTEMLEGDLVVSSFNVENFFTSYFGSGTGNPLEQNRGAESSEDYEMQLQKIIASMKAIDADIFGLIEIENNGFDTNSAIEVLLSALNDEMSADKQYAMAVPADLDSNGWVGTDAITNKIIYRPSQVELLDVFVIDMPQQHVELEDGSYKRAYQRDAFTASFAHAKSEQPLVISTNHFKSKGSSCWEDDHEQDGQDPNLQGSCENFRVSAAYHLAEELAKVDGYKILMGDLNSYGMEDPMMVLTNRDKAADGYQIRAARNTYLGGNENTGTLLHGDNGALIEQSYGYIDIVEELMPHTYSYSYNDEVGTLDYVLVDAELQEFVIDAKVWPINAVESTLFEYDSRYSGDFMKFADPYRSSDHDPAVVVIQFEGDDNNGGDGSDDSNSSSGGSSSLLVMTLMSILAVFRRKKWLQ